MEFNNLEVSKSSVLLQLKHPATREPLWAKEPVYGEEGQVIEEGDPVGVYIFSTDSDQYQKRKKALLNQRIENAQKQNSKKPTADDVLREELLTISACIDRFHNVDLDGQPIGDTRLKFGEFLIRFSWAKEQIDTAMADRGLFIVASSKT